MGQIHKSRTGLYLSVAWKATALLILFFIFIVSTVDRIIWVNTGGPPGWVSSEYLAKAGISCPGEEGGEIKALDTETAEYRCGQFGLFQFMNRPKKSKRLMTEWNKMFSKDITEGEQRGG